MKILILAIIVCFVSSCTNPNAFGPNRPKAHSTDYTFRQLEVVRKVDIKIDSETVTTVSQGHQFKAVVRLRPFTQRDIQDQKYWFGVDGDLPRRVVDSIRLERNGQELTIPARIYPDFGAIPTEPQQRLIELFADGDTLLLQYSGSDGAGSYESKFYFKGESFDYATIQGGTRKVFRD